MNVPPFRPPALLRNRHLQSVLASQGLRRWLRRAELAQMQQQAEHALLDCGDGVRLQGWYNAPESGSPRALAVLLHGWEGSARSSYLGHTALMLRAAGFAVFRLEFRDHGDGQHLNEGVFHSCRIDEVVGAVRAIQTRWPVAPLLLAGFSLGGNFALRVALRAPAAGIALTHALAVCPAIDPHRVMLAMERGPFFYRRYFMAKWRRSLRRKQAAFPDRYDFEPWLREQDMRALTRQLIVHFGEFESLEQYLDGYSLTGDRLAELRVPTTILTSQDDPIIPVDTVLDMQLPGCARLHVTPFGGHCGFLQNLRLHGWAERFILAAFEDAISPTADRMPR